MLRYCLKRILHMIPILFGVVLLTFILFNVVGGSPAPFVLGKNASAQALDEFDDQFGYNKPLFWGKKLKTRLISDHFELKIDEKTPKMENPATGTATTMRWLREASGGRSAGSALPVCPTAGRTLCQGSADPAHSAGYTCPLTLNYAPKPGKTYLLSFSMPEEGNSFEPYLVLQCSDAKNDEKTQKIPLKRSFSTLETRFFVPEGTNASKNAVLSLVLPKKNAVLIEKCRIYQISEHFFNSQFLDYLFRLSRLDMGVSTATNQRVTDILRQGVWPSLALNLPILLGGLVVSVVLALLCAWHRGRLFDRFAVFAATGLMSVNYIVWIVAGQYFFAYRLGWFPIWGFESWRYLLLPVAIGIVSGLGKDVRFYRTVMLEEVYRDYVRTARAKGLSDSTILFKHVLRNALVPIITNVSLTLPFLFTGSLLLETFFGIPGLGGISVNAINSSDMAVVQAVVLIGALLYVVINLLTDICYAWVDPRIRLK